MPCPEIITISVSVFATVATTSFGAWLGHTLTTGRDAENQRRTLMKEARDRRRHFVGVLNRWNYQIRRTNTSDDVWDRYSETVCDMVYEAGIVAADFEDRERFKAMVHDLARLTRIDVGNDHKQSIEKIATNLIEKLMVFVEPSEKARHDATLTPPA